MGNSFVQALTDTLWTVDGHHDVFSSQGFALPKLFHAFNGYNCPELSKHRKRSRGNLSSSVLQSLSSHLFHCLQGCYWDRENWKQLKPAVEKLATALSNYTAYLNKSCKTTLLNQASPTPVRQLSDNLTFIFVRSCALLFSMS